MGRFLATVLFASVSPIVAFGQTALPDPGALTSGGTITEPAPLTAPPGTGPALTPRVTQTDLLAMTLKEMRKAGQRVFTTPFNKFDGMGDGPVDPLDPTAFGGRPSIGGNGTWLRVNGNDSQTCLECHFVLSNREIPATFDVGGVGGIAASAFPGLINFDIGDADANGIADVDGRKINPPFIWGAGGVELVAKEMTAKLQALKQDALDNPNTVVSLDAKGVNFGTLSHDGVDFDFSNVEGVDHDLVVKPFGRKGNNDSIRVFDTGALQFHHGMQPAEVFGDGVDADGDGVANEILDGELSALHVYTVATKRPRVQRGNTLQVLQGQQNFIDAGCATCHVPAIVTDSRELPVAYPEVPTDPWANVFINVDLVATAKFTPSGTGVEVPMFSDLKRHDMGPGLAETTGSPLDSFFITPRLWGIADTAPYLHDGRALTLTDAILMHGGEGQAAADAFNALSSADQIDLLAYLDTLRAPRNPNADL